MFRDKSLGKCEVILYIYGSNGENKQEFWLYLKVLINAAAISYKHCNIKTPKL